jgi:hypothetical protein
VVYVCVICVICDERSYHVNCTRSRPIPEVKLRRVQPVVRCLSTFEAWILFVLICSSLRLRYCKQHTSYAIILENDSMLIWVRSQKSEVRSQKSEVRSQKSDCCWMPCMQYIACVWYDDLEMNVMISGICVCDLCDMSWTVISRKLHPVSSDPGS